MSGLRQKKKNLKKLEEKLINMIPVVTTKHNQKKARVEANAKIIGGIAAGVAVGVAAGLLFAPKAGKETREDIKNKAAKAVDVVKKETNNVVDAVKQKQGTKKQADAKPKKAEQEPDKDAVQAD